MTPRWDAHQFPKDPVNNELALLVSGDGSAPLQIHQNATIHAGRLTTGAKINHVIRHQAYVLVASGSAVIESQLVQAGDGAEIVNQSEVEITTSEGAEILIIDVPATA